MGLHKTPKKNAARALVLIAIAPVFVLCSLILQQWTWAFLQDFYEIRARVKYVIDGDTIVLDNGEHVRYQGINAPEIRHENMDAEPFGYEALRRNKELVEGKLIRLVIDNNNERDRHKRLLAQVFLPDGSRVQEILVSEGLATACAYERGGFPEPVLLRLQSRAIDAKAGMWSVPMARSASERYYIGNRSSRRFHRPSCPLGRQISSANVITFKSREDAFKAGYCPCRKCLP